MALPPEEIKKNKQLASLQRETAITTKSISIDTMTHGQRWVTASLLAINSGGLIATLDQVDQQAPWTVAAFAMFYIGLFFALIMGWLMVSTTQKMLPFHSQIIAFWEEAAIDGEIEMEKLQSIASQMVSATQKNAGYFGLSWWSFAFFTIGIVWIALGGTTIEPNAVTVE